MSDIATQESMLVTHARRELAAIKEEPEFAEKIIDMVKIFDTMGHSGGSAACAIAQLTGILQLQNLSPLTDDPDEWYYHDAEFWGNKETGGVWQNKRNGEAFSHDAGKTYYLLSEGAHDFNRTPMHTSRDHTTIGQI